MLKEEYQSQHLLDACLETCDPDWHEKSLPNLVLVYGRRVLDVSKGIQ